jgi:hypothetical protein
MPYIPHISATLTSLACKPAQCLLSLSSTTIHCTHETRERNFKKPNRGGFYEKLSSNFNFHLHHIILIVPSQKIILLVSWAFIKYLLEQKNEQCKTCREKPNTLYNQYAFSYKRMQLSGKNIKEKCKESVVIPQSMKVNDRKKHQDMM